MQITNDFDLPAPVVAAVSKDDYSRGPSNRSITQLIGAPRVRILQHVYDDVITEDVTDRVWSILGKAVHKIFEDATTATHLLVPEERIYLERQGWIISGAIDLQELEGDLIITDYKCTSIWSVIYGKAEWEYQLNAYCWLARHAKRVNANKLRVIPVLRDWSKSDIEKHGRPQRPIMVYPINRWTDEEQDAYMEERIRIHSDAEFERLTGGQIPPCTDEERWRKPDQYAVKKSARHKTAVRVLASSKAAEEYRDRMKDNDKVVIERRPGKSAMCEGNYCHVAAFCDQYQAELNAAK